MGFFAISINTQGVSISKIEIAIGGANSPHTHLRTTEFGVLIRGALLFGFVTSDNVFYSKVTTPGMVFVIPRASILFSINGGKEEVLFFVCFNSQLPGTQAIPSALFNATPPIPNEVLARAFLVSDDVANTIRSTIASA